MLALLLGAGLASACAEPERRHSAGPDGMGPDYAYSEQRLGADRFRISASSGAAVSREAVANYLLFRAGELAIDRGYEGFRVVGTDAEPKNRHPQSYRGGLGPPLAYAVLPGPLYNPGYLGGPRDAYRRPDPRRDLGLEILLLEELPAAPHPGVHVAREAITRLAPAIDRPRSLAN